MEPLRVFLKQLMAGASRRTKRVARNRVIQEDAWTAERVRAWRAAHWHTAHVARLRFCADADLNVTAEIKDVFQHSYAQGQCRMNALMHVAEDDQGDVIVLVCLLYTSPSPRDQRGSRMPSSA